MGPFPYLSESSLLGHGNVYEYFKNLMTLHTTVTRSKHDSEEAQNCSFITDPDNSGKLGPALDVKLQAISDSFIYR